MLIEGDKYLYIEDIEDIEKIEKIAKTIIISYKDDYKIKKVEDIDIDENNEMPNILVYKNDIIRINFENILSSVKIIIIKYFDMVDMKNYENIPENIEYIIINGEEFKNYETSIDYIINVLEPEDKLNIENSRGWTVIDQIIKELSICYSNEEYYEMGEELEEYLMKIIDKIEKEKLMKKYNEDQNILRFLRNKNLIKIILNKLNKDEINELVKRDNILFNSSYKEDIKLMIIPYLTIETINNKKLINNENITVLTYLIIENKRSIVNKKNNKIIEELIKRVYKIDITKEEIDNIIKLNEDEIKKIFE
jgi:hypothetical protein